MLEFESFEFKGDMFYRDKTLVPLNQGDLVLFKGINLDGAIGTEEEGLSNGAGKTRIPQLLQAFIFGSCDRGNFKNIITDDFEGTLKFRSKAGVSWEFGYVLEEDLWTVKQDGVKITQIFKPSEYRDLLIKELGYSKKEWSNFIHVTGESVNLLLKGKGAARRDYLELFFNIDDFYKDQRSEYVKNKEDLETRLNTLYQDQAALNQAEISLKSLPEEKWLNIQIECLEENLPVKQSELKEEQEKKNILDNQIKDWEEYYSLFSKVEGKGKLPILKEKFRNLNKEIAELREKEIQKKKAETLINRLIKLENAPIEPESIEPDLEEIVSLEQKLSKIRQKIALKQKIKNLSLNIPEVDDPTQDISMLQFIVDNFKKEDNEIERNLKLLKTGDKCITCGQKLLIIKDNESAEETIQKLLLDRRELTIKIGELTDQIETLRKYNVLVKQLVDLQKEYDAFPVYGVKMEDVEKELNALKVVANEWKMYKQKLDQYNILKNKYDQTLAEAKGLGYPEILKENNAQRISEISQELPVLDQDIDLLTNFEQVAFKVLTYKPMSDLLVEKEESSNYLDTIQEQINKLIELKSEYKTNLSMIKQFQKNIEELNEKLKDKDTLEREHRILEGMVKFFSPSGFKLYELKNRCQSLIDQANRWSPIFFQEQHEWMLSKDIDNIDFLVRPLKGHNAEPFSCSLLSKGEENRASRVLLFSQLSIEPPDKETNLLFLDEIEGNLDQAGLNAFNEIVIPKLKELFPHKTIVIISHQPSLISSDAIEHLWVTQKKDRISTFFNYPKYKKSMVYKNIA